MAAALPTADAVSAKLLCLSLLQRQNSEACVALVLAYNHLPYEAQEAIVHHADDLIEPMRRVSRLHSSAASENIIQIISRAQVAELSDLLAAQLRNRSSNVRAHAAHSLLVMAKAASTLDPVTGQAARSPRHPPKQAEKLSRAVEAAVADYRLHRELDVLIALATMCPRPLPNALRYLSERSNHALDDLGRLMGDPEQVAVRRATLMFAAVPALGEAVRHGVLVAGASGRIGDILTTGYLLLNGRAKRTLSRLENVKQAWPGRDQTGGLKPHESVWLGVWARALPFTEQEKAVRLGALSNLPDRLSRLAALRGLMLLDTDGVEEAASSYCFDAAAEVARIAMRFLIRRRWSGLITLLPRLVNSPHDEVRHLAGKHLAPLGFARLWNAWPKLAAQQRLVLGRAVIKIDSYFHKHLADRLVSSTRADRLRALSIIQGLNQGPYFEEALLVLAESEDHVIASAAVGTLGSAPSAVTEAMLHKALDHDNSRVRANAVEALRHIQATGHVQRLAEMAEADEPRPRANAIGALMQMRADDALAALNRMLHDERSTQRASALWLINSMGLIELARHVAELAVSDPSDQVQKRADETVKHLIEILELPALEHEPATTA